MVPIPAIWTVYDVGCAQLYNLLPRHGGVRGNVQMAQPSRSEMCQDAQTHLYHVLVKERPGNEAYSLHFWTAIVELNMGGG